MTARELARLQTFPDDFIFKGSKKDILVQIGNAVPCLLGKHIGQVIQKIIGQ
jgi:DNA (cytosine-5)-methyltransferase 1